MEPVLFSNLIIWEQGILTLEASFLEHFADPKN
jgi:hypothetical protein